MKKIIYIFSVFLIFGCASSITAQSMEDISSIRNELFYSDFDFSKCLDYYNRIVQVANKSPLIQAYQAAAEALLAKHSWNPVNKYTYLKNAQALLDRAVNADKKNPEIRFLRLYIQRSIPSYMGMSRDIMDDKKAIMENLDQLNSSQLGQKITEYIVKYMSAPDLTTEPEANQIKKSLGVDTEP